MEGPQLASVDYTVRRMAVAAESRSSRSENPRGLTCKVRPAHYVRTACPSVSAGITTQRRPSTNFKTTIAPEASNSGTLWVANINNSSRGALQCSKTNQ